MTWHLDSYNIFVYLFTSRLCTKFFFHHCAEIIIVNRVNDLWTHFETNYDIEGGKVIQFKWLKLDGYFFLIPQASIKFVINKRKEYIHVFRFFTFECAKCCKRMPSFESCPSFQIGPQLQISAGDIALFLIPDRFGDNKQSRCKLV